MIDIHIDFWFTMGSAYSFLSVMSLADLERSEEHHFAVLLAELRIGKFHPHLSRRSPNHMTYAPGPPTVQRELENTRYRDR
jgi:2-hydroxychromene-2-carboxylate isomerase